MCKWTFNILVANWKRCPFSERNRTYVAGVFRLGNRGIRRARGRFGYEKSDVFGAFAWRLLQERKTTPPSKTASCSRRTTPPTVINHSRSYTLTDGAINLKVLTRPTLIAKAAEPMAEIALFRANPGATRKKKTITVRSKFARSRPV